MAQQPLVGRGLLVIEALRSYSDTAQSVGVLWPSDKRDAEASTWQHTTQHTDIHVPTGFEPAIPASQRPQTHSLFGNGNCQIFPWVSRGWVIVLMVLIVMVFVVVMSYFNRKWIYYSRSIWWSCSMKLHYMFGLLVLRHIYGRSY